MITKTIRRTYLKKLFYEGQFTSDLKIHYLVPPMVLESKSRKTEGAQVRYVQEEQGET